MNLLMTVGHWFSQGGAVMYLLLLASIGAGTVIIDRMRYYRSRQSDFKQHAAEVRQVLQTNSLAEAAELYQKRRTSLDRLTAAAFKARLKGKSVELAVEGAAQLEAAQLKKGLPLLGMLVTLAPILGLMGTVVGMIQTFSVFNLQAGSPMAITGGVGEALIATVTGLAVATFALLGHSYFGYRLDGMVTDMERLGTWLEDKLSAGSAERMAKRGQEKHEAA